MDRITSPGDIVTGPRGSWVYVRSHVCSDKKDNIIVTVVEERKREKERERLREGTVMTVPC